MDVRNHSKEVERTYLLFECERIASRRPSDLRTIGTIADIESERVALDLVLYAFAEAGTVDSHD